MAAGGSGACGEMTIPATAPPGSGQPPPVFGQLTKAEMLAIVKEQALNKQKKKDSPARTFQEQIKFYATFSFSLIAITGFSVLMFLVPFIVDPALAMLTADFVEKPVECRVTFSKAILGNDKKYFYLKSSAQNFIRHVTQSECKILATIGVILLSKVICFSCKSCTCMLFGLLF